MTTREYIATDEGGNSLGRYWGENGPEEIERRVRRIYWGLRDDERIHITEVIQNDQVRQAHLETKAAFSWISTRKVCQRWSAPYND